MSTRSGSPARMRQPMSARGEVRPLQEKLQQLQSKLLALSTEFTEHREQVNRSLTRLGGESDGLTRAKVSEADRGSWKQAFEDLEMKVTRASELSCDVYDQQIEYQTQCDRRFCAMQDTLAEMRFSLDLQNQNGITYDSRGTVLQDVHLAVERLRGELSGFLPAIQDVSSSTANNGRGIGTVILQSDLIQFTDALLRNLGQSLEVKPCGSRLESVPEICDERTSNAEGEAKQCRDSWRAIAEARENACERINAVAQDTCTQFDRKIRSSLECSSKRWIEDASSELSDFVAKQAAALEQQISTYQRLETSKYSAQIVAEIGELWSAAESSKHTISETSQAVSKLHDEVRAMALSQPMHPIANADSGGQSLDLLDRIRADVAAQIGTFRSANQDECLMGADRSKSSLRSETHEELIEATESLRAVALEMCESQKRAKREARSVSERLMESLAAQRSSFSEEIQTLTTRMGRLDIEGKHRRYGMKDGKSKSLDAVTHEILEGRRCHEELACAFQAATTETNESQQRVLSEVEEYRAELKALRDETLASSKSTLDGAPHARDGQEEDQVQQATSRRYAAYAAVTQRAEQLRARAAQAAGELQESTLSNSSVSLNLTMPAVCIPRTPRLSNTANCVDVGPTGSMQCRAISPGHMSPRAPYVPTYRQPSPQSLRTPGAHLLGNANVSIAWQR